MNEKEIWLVDSLFALLSNIPTKKEVKEGDIMGNMSLFLVIVYS